MLDDLRTQAHRATEDADSRADALARLLLDNDEAVREGEAGSPSLDGPGRAALEAALSATLELHRKLAEYAEVVEEAVATRDGRPAEPPGDVPAGALLIDGLALRMTTPRGRRRERMLDRRSRLFRSRHTEKEPKRRVTAEAKLSAVTATASIPLAASAEHLPHTWSMVANTTLAVLNAAGAGLGIRAQLRRTAEGAKGEAKVEDQPEG